MAQVLEDVKVGTKPAGDVIREKRVAAGLSQDGLAAVKGVSMTGLRIARLERTNKGTKEEVEMLTKALAGVKVDPTKINPLVGKGRPRGIVAAKPAAKKAPAKKAAAKKTTAKRTPAKKTAAKPEAISDLI